MKIEFQCPNCQKNYSVSANLAGKKAKCKKCEHRMTIPQIEGAGEPGATSQAAVVHPTPIAAEVPPVEVIPQVVPATPVQATPVQATPGQATPVQATPVQATPVQATPAQVQPPQVPPITATQVSPTLSPSEQLVLDAQQHGSPLPAKPSILMGDTQASNPGRLKVNKLKYATSYPFWFWIWHGGLMLSLAIIYLSPIAGIVSSILFGAICWFYWTRVTGQFAHGCANPAKIISLDPPLIAAYTDLTKGDYETPVIKVTSEPISKMAGGPYQVGQIIPTVAFYEDRFDTGPHWSTFDPKPVALVTTNEADIDRILRSFDAEDLGAMELGLQQIPTPPVIGHYRIYSAEQFHRPFNKSALDIQNLVYSHFNGVKRIKIGGEIDPEMKGHAASYVPQQALNQLWAQIELINDMDGKNGICFTAYGIYYQLKNGKRGQIGYDQIVGGLSSNSGLEITLRDGQRIYLEDKYFLSDTLEPIDLLLDAIAS